MSEILLGSYPIWARLYGRRTLGGSSATQFLRTSVGEYPMKASASSFTLPPPTSAAIVGVSSILPDQLRILSIHQIYADLTPLLSVRHS